MADGVVNDAWGRRRCLLPEDPDGLEFEILWTVPGGISIRTRPLALGGEGARRGTPMR